MQIQGNGGAISNLNFRLYLLRRLARAISKDRLRKIADSLYTSKIQYGLQLFGKVRLSENDSTESLLKVSKSPKTNLPDFYMAQP